MMSDTYYRQRPGPASSHANAFDSLSGKFEQATALARPPGQGDESFLSRFPRVLAGWCHIPGATRGAQFPLHRARAAISMATYEYSFWYKMEDRQWLAMRAKQEAVRLAKEELEEEAADVRLFWIDWPEESNKSFRWMR